MSDRPKVLSLESRRATEIGRLIETFGGEPTVAPSMREVPLEQNAEALAFGRDLLAGHVDAVVFLTGVGAKALMAVLETEFAREDVLAALDRAVVIIRGPKPAAVLKDWGTRVDHRAPEPNTWRDLVEELDRAGRDLSGMRVAVQEYGQPSTELHAALTERGAAVRSVTVYAWQLPEDLGPLEAAVRGVAAGRFDTLLITSAQQIRHALQVSAGLGLEDAFRAGVSNVRVCSIGPTASEALRGEGIEPAMEPSSPKMGHLVREALAQ